MPDHVASPFSKRMLILLSGQVLLCASSFDEAHAIIDARARRNSLSRASYRVVDRWTELGYIEDRRGRDSDGELDVLPFFVWVDEDPLPIAAAVEDVTHVE